MANIKVKVTKMAYFDNKRHREGTILFMDEKLIKVDKAGKVLAPSWIELVDEYKPKGKKVVVEEELPKELTEEVI